MRELRGGGRRGGGHRFELLSGGVVATAVHADEEVLAGQACVGHRQQQLAGGDAPAALFDRLDHGVQGGGDAQHPVQLGHRGDARGSGQPGIGCPDPHRRAVSLPPRQTRIRRLLRYHRFGALPGRVLVVIANTIFPARRALPCHRRPGLLTDSGLRFDAVTVACQVTRDRVDSGGQDLPRLACFLRRSHLGFLAEETKRAYAKDYRLFFSFLYQREQYWDEADHEDVDDYESWRRRSVDNPHRIGGSKWARESAAFKLLYGWSAAVGHVDRSPVLTHTVRRRDGTVAEVANKQPKYVRHRTSSG